jgi:hypothetical protein
MLLIQTLLITGVLRMMRSTSALNELQNIDVATEKENGKLRSRKIKRAVPSQWKRKIRELL